MSLDIIDYYLYILNVSDFRHTNPLRLAPPYPPSEWPCHRDTNGEEVLEDIHNEILDDPSPYNTRAGTSLKFKQLIAMLTDVSATDSEIGNRLKIRTQKVVEEVNMYIHLLEAPDFPPRELLSHAPRMNHLIIRLYDIISGKLFDKIKKGIEITGSNVFSFAQIEWDNLGDEERVECQKQIDALIRLCEAAQIQRESGIECPLAKLPTKELMDALLWVRNPHEGLPILKIHSHCLDEAPNQAKELSELPHPLDGFDSQPEDFLNQTIEHIHKIRETMQQGNDPYKAHTMLPETIIRILFLSLEEVNLLKPESTIVANIILYVKNMKLPISPYYFLARVHREYILRLYGDEILPPTSESSDHDDVRHSRRKKALENTCLIYA